MRAAPTCTSTAFSAISPARATALLASSASLTAAVRVRVAVAFAFVAAVLRASAPRLAARVWAAFLAAVERFVAFVLRVAAAFSAAATGSVLGVVVSAMSSSSYGLRLLVLTALHTIVPEHMFVNPPNGQPPLSRSVTARTTLRR